MATGGEQLRFAHGFDHGISRIGDRGAFDPRVLLAGGIAHAAHGTAAKTDLANARLSIQAQLAEVQAQHIPVATVTETLP